jgi:ribonuclease HI
MSDSNSLLNSLTIHTDGGARGNPGPAAAGYVIRAASGTLIHQSGKYLGHTTNNMAEYQGVIDALEWLSAHQNLLEGNPPHLDFYLDSALVVNQIVGRFKVREPRFIPLLSRIHALLLDLGNHYRFTAIPREQNKAADALVNQALDAHIAS